MPTRIKHWIELQLQIKYELWMSKSLEQTPQPKIPGKALPVFRSQSLPLVQSHISEEATVAALSPLKSRTMPMNSSNVRSCKTKRKGEEWWPLPPASHAYQLGRSPWSSFNTFQLPLRHLILLKYEVHEVDECKKLRSRGRERERDDRNDAWDLLMSMVCGFQLRSSASFCLCPLVTAQVESNHLLCISQATSTPTSWSVATAFLLPRSISSSCRSQAEHALGRGNRLEKQPG